MVDYLLLGLQEHYAALRAAGRNWVEFRAAYWTVGWCHDWDDPPPTFGGHASIPRDFTGQPQGEAFGDLVLEPDDPDTMGPELATLPSLPRHVLYRAGFTTVGQVAGASDRELLALRGMGRGSLAQVRAVCPVPPRTCPHCGGRL